MWETRVVNYLTDRAREYDDSSICTAHLAKEVVRAVDDGSGVRVKQSEVESSYAPGSGEPKQERRAGWSTHRLGGKR